MSYSQIATVAEIPMGTVMSRLNRARHQLKQMVSFEKRGEGDPVIGAISNVLLISDDEESHAAIGRMLKREHLAPMVAADAQSGLEQAFSALEEAGHREHGIM